MSIKVIAIGNRLMNDDALGLCIAERLRESLEKKKIEVVICETDFQYALSQIEEGDSIIILDATWFGIEAGAVTMSSLKDIYSLNTAQGLFSQHGYSLITAVNNYYKSIKGTVIGIEGINFDYGLTLSHEIDRNLENICSKIMGVINGYIEV
jgi:hydrogenase maturation protease